METECFRKGVKIFYRSKPKALQDVEKLIRNFKFDTIYVSGSNNFPNLVLAEDTWKVRLIEEEFSKRMWETEGVRW